MKKSLALAALVVLTVLAAGCVEQQPQAVRSLVVDGIEYSFTNDVREADKVPVYFTPTVRDAAFKYRNMFVVFDCSVTEENPYFAVAAYNAVSTLQNYLVYSKTTFAVFNTYCFVGSQWYNATNDQVEMPSFANTTTLWFKGPSSGANETDVYLSYNNTIVIEGTDYGNLTLAADAFSLVVLGAKTE